MSFSFSAKYLLGYILAHNRICLVDHDINVYAYGLSLAVVEYQTAIPSGDMDTASKLLGGDLEAQGKRVILNHTGRSLIYLTFKISTGANH